MHGGYKQHMKDKVVTCFLNLQAFQRGVRNPYDVALQGRMHAAGRLGDTQLVYT